LHFRYLVVSRKNQGVLFMSPIIRLVTESDAEQVLKIYAPFCSDSPVSFETKAPTKEEMQQRIGKILQKFPWLVCEYGGEVIGYVYAAPHRDRAAYQWSVDVSVYISEAMRRLGVGRALYTSLFKVLVLQGYYNAYAGITLPNPGSVGLHEAMGFQPIGIYRGVGYKGGTWHDVQWFELWLQPRLPNPQHPRDIKSLYDTVELEQALNSGLSALLIER
jgi:L-amino acid N-acyltransferase YncA